MTDLEETHVVTCFLRNRGEVLLLRRSEEVGSYRGRWGGVAGHVENDPVETARHEIEEESGLLAACTLVRQGEPFTVDDADVGKRWVVHPFLFDCESRDITTDWESVEAEWVAPPEILHRRTVPRLWTSYRHVAPTVDSIEGDREHGSAWLSLRALEVLRDAAAEDMRWEELASLAFELIRSRPAMTALHNRAHRAMFQCEGNPARLARVAHETLLAAADADQRAASAAAEAIRGKKAFTLSRSGTVLQALHEARCSVTVAASMPLGEGVELAEQLAGEGLAVTLCPDSASALVLHAYGIDVALIGADTISPDASVVNKIGTHPVALAARAARVPMYVVAARDKIAPAPTEHGGAWSRPNEADGNARSAAEPRVGRAEVYRGDARLDVVDVLFETTPAQLFSGVITEDGVLDSAGVRNVAAEHKQMRRWQARA